MGKHYLFYVAHSYAYAILFPLEEEIARRGGVSAWFVEQECPAEPLGSRRRIETFDEVEQFAPIAVFAPGNYIPDFFPGVKVALFHGYPINKRAGRHDDHFTIRGWFDLYCTQGPSSTKHFEELAKRLGTFRVCETGWAKTDSYIRAAQAAEAAKRVEVAEGAEGAREAEADGKTREAPQTLPNSPNYRPTVLYSSTFSRSLTSTTILASEIERMVASGEWNWIFMFHPKLDNYQTLAHYRTLAERYDNARYFGNTFDMEAMLRADVMLCDSSSIIMEFMLLDKPVVTFRNSMPGSHLLNVTEVEAVEPAIAEALTRPETLMSALRAWRDHHEAHCDGLCSARILDAVDALIADGGAMSLRTKPLNLVRKIKLRKRLGYPLFRKLRSVN